MPQSDSVDKIVQRYFACLTRKSFTYKGKTYDPKPLVVSPLLLRDYTCPANCGGCCHLRFSLDYLPNESQPEGTSKRYVELNGKKVAVYSIMQDDSDIACQHLDRENGRCGIYTTRPFSCDFELIRTLEFASQSKPNVLTQKLFGRGWNMKRIDGERGALCEMTDITKESRNEVIRKLKRLKEWADHFRVETWADRIIELLETATFRLERPLKLGFPSQRRGFLKQ